MALPVVPLILHRPWRFAAAVAGIGLAVLLMFVQLGFLNGISDSQAHIATFVQGDLVLIHPHRTHLNKWNRLRAEQIRRALPLAGVADVIPVYKGSGQWQNGKDQGRRRIIVYAFPPGTGALKLPAAQEALLRTRGNLLFDSRSRDIFGEVEPGRRIELDGRSFTVAGLVGIGPNLVNDGQLLMSEGDWKRLHPGEPPMMAVVRLAAGADVATVASAIDGLLGDQVEVLTPQALFQRETAYTRQVAPIGLLFGFGMLVCLVIGALICYQIQFSEIQETAPALATLRAVGFGNLQVALLTLRQGMLYALGGYLLAVPAAFAVYWWLAAGTHLVMQLTLPRLGLILALVLAMGAVSGLLSLRRILRLDVAELY